ncbi:MAG: alpha/beta hydrolase [Phycisphaerales bacterium]|nr:alpha/beta hydrolase [Phycisphaerales bacterium]
MPRSPQFVLPDPRPVDSELQRLLTIIHDVQSPTISNMTPADARAWSRNFVDPDLPRRPVTSVLDRSFQGPGGDVPVRLYHPKPGTVLPMLVFFHGGGWVVGDLESADDSMRRLAAEAECLVISVDYRLAPESPFPAAVEDAIAAVKWSADHAIEFDGDPTRLAVGGDSAGGNLAAVAAIDDRHSGAGRISFQYLSYPVTDANFNRPSMFQFAERLLLERQAMSWFWDHYCPDLPTRKNWNASPVHTSDLSGVAPAFIHLAAHDPLFDEGCEFADRLQEAGVRTELRVAPTMVHGFFGLTAVCKAAEQEIQEACRVVRRELHRLPSQSPTR